jgi:hypothetical protein
MRRSTAVALATVGLAACVALLAAAPAGSELAAQDRCVRGAWKMSNAASNAVLQSLVQTPNISVEQGVLTAAFPRTGTMRYGSTHFVVKIDGGALVMKGTASFIFEAPWSTAGGRLVLGRGRSELFISKFTAIKDGRTITVDGPGATVTRTPAGRTPYTCRGDTLRWRIPINDTQTLFRRVD